MHTKDTVARITIDLPIETHKRLKMTAAVLGKTMREIIIESLKRNTQLIILDKSTIKKRS